MKVLTALPLLFVVSGKHAWEATTGVTGVGTPIVDERPTLDRCVTHN